jgi:hypothetical protein
MPVFPEGHNRMIVLAKDAFTYVNTHLVDPPLAANIVGPGVLSPASEHLRLALVDADTRNALDIPSFHSYWADNWHREIEQGSRLVNSLRMNKKSWVTEWGQWWYEDGYSNPKVVNGMVPSIIEMGLRHIDAHVLYGLTLNETDLGSLVSSSGTRSRLLWEVKLLSRALLAKKDMLTVTFDGTGATVYATQDTENLYAIVLNGESAQTISVDVSALASTDGATVDLYLVGPGTQEEAAEAAAIVSSGMLTVEAAIDTHYVAVIRGAGARVPDQGAAGGAAGSGAADAGETGGVGGSGPSNGASAGRAGSSDIDQSSADDPSSCGCRTSGRGSAPSFLTAACLLGLIGLLSRRFAGREH